MDNIKSILDQYNFIPQHAVECGTAHTTTSLLRDYVKIGVRCDFFEPNPRLFYTLFHGFDLGDFIKTWPVVSRYPHEFEGWGHLPNVRLYNVALGDFSGYVRMFENNASSYIQGVVSPAQINDKFEELLARSYLVRVEPFSRYDDGTIDLLVVDTEGSEWFVVKHLKSRPTVICLETHGGNYRNPYLPQIEEWMHGNGYTPLLSTESDTMWGRNDKIVKS